jgi:voltage-gated potassium channel
MSTTRRPNFVYLLAGLMVTLLAGPVIHEFTDQSADLIVQVAFSGTLIVGIWSFIGSRQWFRIGVILAVLELVVTVFNTLRPSPLLDYTALVIALTFCSLSLVFALINVLRGKRMDANRMTGAICVYLLLGITLGLLNILTYRLIPDSFTGLPMNADAEQGMSIIYYTFVTMTTLGYGDVLPVGPLARALAYMAAIAGQFYIAILVGMMVGVYLSQNQSSSS